MATNFPTSLDALTNPTSSDALSSPSHSTQHANANDAIEALQAKVGIDSSAATTSIDYKLTNNVVLKTAYTGKGVLLAASGASTPAALAAGTDGYVLTADSTQTGGIKWAAAAGGVAGDSDQLVLGSQIFS